MARKKRSAHSKLRTIIGRLTRKFSPDTIQVELGKAYEQNSDGSSTELEQEFWEKCSRASFNLASGMNKWAHEMVEDMEDDDAED